jgi:type II secretory pathway component PulL
MPTIGFAKKVLGISVGERSLIAAEVTCVGPAQVIRLAEFTYPPDLSLEQAPALGIALANFLGAHGFLIRHAVLGVPAKWLFLKSHSIPPTDPQTAASILSLHAEERLGPEFGQMVFDFTGEINFTEPADVLLMGLQRKWLDRLLTMAEAAKLNVLAVTPCADALCATAWSHLDQSFTLSLRPDGAELIERQGRQVRSLRHIGSATAVKSLITELRRTAVSALAKSEDAKDQPRLVVWDELGSDSSVLNELSASAGMPVVRGDVQWLGAEMLERAEEQKGACAVAVGMTARDGKRPRVDFLHSKLQQRKTHNRLWRIAWISTAAAVLITVLAALGDAANLQRQISQADVQLAAMKPALDIARPFLANMQFIESFQTTRPRFLAAIRDLDVAIPPQDSQTYLTNFDLRANMTGLFAGRSDNEQNVMALIDKLRSGGRFTDIRCKLDPRSGRAGAAAELSFFVTFTYVPQK